MYHLYIVKSIGGRIGFGIATDLKERNKHYASHSGDIVQFPLVFGGLRAHAKAVEKNIKRDLWDDKINRAKIYQKVFFINMTKGLIQ